MNYYFSEFINDLCQKYDICKDVDGTKTTVQLLSPAGRVLTAVYDEIDENKRAYVRGAIMYPPINRDGRQQFMDMALRFNCDAISVLNMGVMPHPTDERGFCPTWFVTKHEQTEQEWNKQFKLFEALADKAYESVHKLTMQWVHSLH